MKREKSSIKRYIALFVILAVLIVALAVAPTIARYLRGAADLPNEFDSTGSVEPSVNNGELKDGKLKDVSFNVGTTGYPVFVRVKILVTWKAKDGSVLYWEPQASYQNAEGEEVEGDYSIVFAENAGWEKLGEYYYYTKGVISEGNTPVLVTSFEQLTTEAPINKEKYKMNVEFIVQTVQAVGKTDEDNEAGEIPAWKDAWKDDLNPGSGSDSESGNDTTGEGNEGASEGNQP